ncbi:hypothetical protein QF028_004371 [Neobacillus sp. B4I6]|uniref:hypothetical protein n=1 Tax=Neobacillus sp. B4I6 TaxID=3373925 RepID=UPI003D25F4AD
MAWSRLYNFQNGTKINSGQVNGEFNQLIAAANQLQTDDETKDTNLRAIAQLNKITADTGDYKLKVTNAANDFLAQIIANVIGLQTVYCVAGAVNNPSAADSVRGTAYVYSNFGWVTVFDKTGGVFTNHLDNGAWQGWNKQQSLWSGATYPPAATTITPTKPLSKCRNGWMLVWSDYDPGTGSNDYDIAYSQIPKDTPFLGRVHTFDVPNNASSSNVSTIVKKLTVNDTTLVGSDDNGSATTNTNDVVLRNILEY